MQSYRFFFIIFLIAGSVIEFIPAIPHLIDYYLFKTDKNGYDPEDLQREAVYIKKRLVKSASIIFCTLIPIIFLNLNAPPYVFLPLVIISAAMLPFIFRLVEENVGIFGIKKYKNEAEKRAKGMRYRNPVIKCDSCNSEIDTSLYKVCPHCGAAYDNDLQWQTRHKADTDSEDSSADKFVENQFKQSKIATAKTRKELKASFKYLVYFVIVALVLFGLFAFLSHINSKNDPSKEADELDAKYQYTVSGDNVLLDCDVAKICVEGFQESKINTKGVTIDFSIENRTEKELTIYLRCNGINSSYYSSSETFILNVYESDNKIFNDSFELEKIYIDDLFDISFSMEKIEDMHEFDVIYEAEENNQAVFKTDNKNAFLHSQIPDGEKLYEENGLSVIRFMDWKVGGYSFCVLNKSDESYAVTPSPFIVNGNQSDEEPFEITYIAPGHWHIYRNYYNYFSADKAEFEFDYSTLEAYTSEDSEQHYKTDLIQIN